MVTSFYLLTLTKLCFDCTFCHLEVKIIIWYNDWTWGWLIQGLIPSMGKKYSCPATVLRLALEPTPPPAPMIQGLK